MTNGLVQHITVEESVSTITLFVNFVKGRQHIWLPIYFPGQHSLAKIGSTLEGKNLLLEEQILFFIRVIIPFEKGYKKEMTELLSLKVYSFNVTLLHSEQPNLHWVSTVLTAKGLYNIINEKLVWFHILSCPKHAWCHLKENGTLSG